MKKLFSAVLIIAASVFTQHVHAQLRKIPAEVTDAFKSKFPEAANVEWKDRLSSFEANFKIAETTYEARFNNKGEWQETEKVLDPLAFPGEVKVGFDKSK